MTKECPACQLLNEEEADTCRHCGTAFFFELDCLQPKPDDPADELVVVGCYANVIDASLVQGLLADSGIDACVPEEFALAIGTVEMATVRVAKKHLETARRIIAESRSS